jgi:hypothetical protein
MLAGYKEFFLYLYVLKNLTDRRTSGQDDLALSMVIKEPAPHVAG